MRAESDAPVATAQAHRPLAPFGEVLRRYRRTAGVTQEELAERAGLTREAISLLERGARQHPHPYTVQALSAALGLSPADNAVFVAAARASLDAAPRLLRSGGSVPALVGRVDELALIDRQLLGEGPAVLILAGEPGIGKSRLLAEAHMRASERGWTVLDGGCQRSGQDPYAPLVQALERHLARQPPARRRGALTGCAWMVRLLPDVADVVGEAVPTWSLPPEQEQRLMFAAVGRFLRGVAGRAGTLLVLDDLQWAGADALSLLVTLVHAEESPLRVIGAYRDTEAPPQSPLATMLADLAHAGLLAHHALPPLSAAEAAQMLAHLLDTHRGDEGVRRRLLQRTGGVPFFLVSCALALRAGSRGAGDGEVVPWDVAQSVRQRVAALPDDVREVLGVAAVVGREVPYALLSAACSRPPAALAAALRAACGSRLLEEMGADAYQFTHDVIREVIEADLGTAHRLLRHGRIAQVLERGGEPPADVEALAYHYSRSTEQDKAILYLEWAGDHARDQYAHAAALGYYGAVLERLDRLGRALAAARVRESMGTVLLTIGHYDQALVCLEGAATVYQAAGDLDRHGQMLLTIALAHTARGTPEEPLERLQQALAVLDERAAWPGVAALCVGLSNLYFYWPGRVAEGLSLTERALQLARRLGDDRLLAVAQQDHACNLFKAGRWDEALPGLEEAARRLDALGDLAGVCWCLQTAAGILGPNGQVTQQRAYSDRAVALAERLGDPLVHAMMMAVRGVQAFWSGDWTQTRVDGERALDVSRAIGTWTDLVGATVQPLHATGAKRAEPASLVGPSGHFIACVPLLYLGQLCLAQGDLPTAARYLEEATAVAVHHHDIMAIRSLQAHLDLLAGRPTDAYARLVALSTDPEPWEWWEWPVTPLRVLLAWAHLDVDQVAQATALAEQAAERARAVPSQRALVEALWMQARVASGQGRWAEARRVLDEGVALARRIQSPYAEGRLLHVYGQLHAARGEGGSAQACWEPALAIFQRLGARADAAAVERAWGSLGAV